MEGVWGLVQGRIQSCDSMTKPCQFPGRGTPPLEESWQLSLSLWKQDRVGGCGEQRGFQIPSSLPHLASMVLGFPVLSQIRLRG